MRTDDRAASSKLMTEGQHYPPNYLLAAFLTVLGDDAAEAATYCTSEDVDASETRWTVVAVLGSALALLTVSGPPVSFNRRDDQATSMDARVHRLADVTSVEAQVVDVRPDHFEQSVLLWNTIWTIHLSDGAEVVLPRMSDLTFAHAREAADQTATAVLKALSSS